MGRPFLLIDGYNLMHAAGMARAKYGPGGLQKRRNRFLAYLSGHLNEEQRCRTTVVFDAGDAPWGVSRQDDREGMHVIFASPGGDADDLIEELIASHSAPRQLRVISSDHRLQKAARRRRAKSIDSEDFVAELERRGRPGRSRASAPHPKFTGQTSDKETETWLEVFGDVPEAAELKTETESEGTDPQNEPNGIDQLQAEIDKLIEEADESSDNV